ncbi:hypothetical protein L6164_027900 [Bauhinia variegata]|uniref:Uncharacterized protein n=1 Tax=Bauhinia variegata TaxID=167791 RepID=A0ACB9LW10_BAUVA|nr:hypothetical protein L6164_027900 [Bauhinia variegata]
MLLVSFVGLADAYWNKQAPLQLSYISFPDLKSRLSLHSERVMSSIQYGIFINPISLYLALSLRILFEITVTFTEAAASI